MKQVKIQNITLPPVVLGTWGWASGINGSQAVFGSTPSAEEIQKCYRSAVKNGLCLFDTAAVYGFGKCEKLLGEISENDNIIISTKFTPFRFQLVNMAKSLDKSLKRLKKDCVDIFWIHNTIHLEKNINTALALLQQGKIKNIGLSNCTLKDIKFADEFLKKNGYRLFGVQNHYSLIYTFSEKSGITDYCRENGIAFFPYMILEQGLIAGKKQFPKNSRRGKTYSEDITGEVAPLVEILSETGKKHNVSAVQIAVAHAMSKNMIPIVGVRSEKQAEELAKAVGIELSQDEIDEIQKTADSISVEVKALWE